MKGRERIIVVTMLQYYPESPSGSAKIAFDEAIYLAEAGHKVWVITQDESGSAPDYAFMDGLHVLRYARPIYRALDPSRGRAHQVRVIDLLRRYIRDSPVDLLHGHSVLQYDAARSYLGHNVRQCYSVHSPVYMEKRAEGRDRAIVERLSVEVIAQALHRVESRCVKTADVITAFSNYTRNLIGSVYGQLSEDRTIVVPGWVDTRRFTIAADRAAFKSSLGWPLDRPVLFTLRRFVPRMGLDRLLHALKIVQTAGFGFHAIIAGEGRLRPDIESLAKDLGLTESVSFPGRIPDSLLPKMYAAADAFVLPTTELECFGLIALESLASGTPVVATPVGAIPEVLRRFEPEWLARDATAESLAQRLVDFLEHRLPHHEPRALRRQVARLYGKDVVLERFVRTAVGE